MFNGNLQRQINELETRIHKLEWELYEVKNDLLITIPKDLGLPILKSDKVPIYTVIYRLLDYLNLKLVKQESQSYIKFESTAIPQKNTKKNEQND